MVKQIVDANPSIAAALKNPATALTVFVPSNAVRVWFVVARLLVEKRRRCCVFFALDLRKLVTRARALDPQPPPRSSPQPNHAQAFKALATKMGVSTNVLLTNPLIKTVLYYHVSLFLGVMMMRERRCRAQASHACGARFHTLSHTHTHTHTHTQTHRCCPSRCRRA